MKESIDMEDIKVSIFASAIRPRLWKEFFESLESMTESYEVVFAGPSLVAFEDIGHKLGFAEIDKNGKRAGHYIEPFPKNFKYIKTENTKPAQCYEIAFRHCKGETISWSADDCVYSPDCLGKAYRYWKSMQNEKLALSIQTVEDDFRYNMNDHSFVGFDRTTPLMAPVVLMSRKVLNELGGFDRRFVCGQYENSAIMDLYEVGGGVIIFDDGYVSIDHEKKHKGDHKFRAGYSKDREVLEKIWGRRGELLHTGKSLKKEPFIDKDILIKSQSNNNSSIWV